MAASHGQREKSQIVKPEMKRVLLLGKGMKNGFPGAEDLLFRRTNPEGVVVKGLQKGRNVIAIILGNDIGRAGNQFSNIYSGSLLVSKQVIF